jgi:DNA-binding NarL/FixJ family response regulator
VKTTPPEKLLEAIRDEHAGGAAMSHLVARRVIQTFHKPPSVPAPAALLTSREKQVLDQLAHGFIYKIIAQHLGVSTETVRTHVRNIYKKL